MSVSEGSRSHGADGSDPSTDSRRSFKRNEISDDFTRSLKKNKRIDFTSGPENKTTCNVGGDMTESLSSGQKVLFACSGIAVERERHVTKFMTSTNLLRVFNEAKMYHDDLKVEVRHEGKVAIGYLGEYILEHGIATVNVVAFPDMDIILPNHRLNIVPHSKVVSVGRGISGELMTTCGILIANPRESRYCPSCVMVSTCKISEALEGGLLCDSDGNFLGINLFSTMEGTLFLPASILIDQLACFQPLRKIKFPVPLENVKGIRVGKRLKVRGDFLEKNKCLDLDSMGYPKPPASMSNGLVKVSGMNLLKQSLPTYKKILLRLLHSMIVVLLPNKQCREGTLQHYNLHYNIALVSVKDFNSRHPANIQHRLHIKCFKVIAVGCSFETGTLMDARGQHSGWPVTADYRFLRRSTCEITKVGIGGPLVGFDGKFLGMNFYNKKPETPYVPYHAIVKVLEHFKTKGTVAEFGHVDKPSEKLDWTIPGDRSLRPNRWPVPMPRWCRPEDLD
uniref:Uncharacterized protein n=1 Tax=Leersia perrieri TaxID=77586 RepID=A0A0D9W2R8_9ORYZ